ESPRGCPCCSNRKIYESNCLATNQPGLITECHPTKNGAITPWDVVAGSHHKAWWKCPAAEDHEWLAQVSLRTRKEHPRGCPCCSGRNVVKSNCLATIHPELITQWHPTKNGYLTPWDVVPGSNRKIWWQCPVAKDHEWEAQVCRRTDKENPRGCPCCSGRKVVASNCLATNHPELIEQWHPIKNGTLTPRDVVPGSDRKVWWQCPVTKDHVWQAQVSRRTNRKNPSGCPCCSGHKIVESNCLASTHPELISEWVTDLNSPLTPFNVGKGSNKIVHWRCSKKPTHVWSTKVALRTSTLKTGCPYCAGQKVDEALSLGVLHPELSKEWHTEKNKLYSPLTVLPGSNRKVWWQCSVNSKHVWSAIVHSRTAGKTGCPFCINRLPCGRFLTEEYRDYAIANTHPELITEWHTAKNGTLTPQDITSAFSDTVWWRCNKSEDHEWQATPSKRTYSGNGCPFCANRLVADSNCIATTDPEMAAQWHPTLNAERTTSNTSVGTYVKIWWLCNEDPEHVWQNSPVSRKTNKSGCPYCSNRMVSSTNNLGVVFPEIAKEWHPTKNSPLTPFDVVPGGVFKPWWVCGSDPDHVWDATLDQRTRSKSGCPMCFSPVSAESRLVFDELKAHYSDIITEDDVNRADILKISGWRGKFDAYIPSCNMFLEYDGSYYHADKEDVDKRKVATAIKQGFRVIRIRQSPLKALSDLDIVVPNQFDAEVYVAVIHSHIQRCK
ncbi:MAG: zinc-ribbon domain-containing protein, partial [Pseudomonadales bacterium]|nr:zinc-ribbon domain-containing protein [Pseudomonadales bacterium]